jgi:hypothetical protein
LVHTGVDGGELRLEFTSDGQFLVVYSTNNRIDIVAAVLLHMVSDVSSKDDVPETQKPDGFYFIRVKV